MNLIVYDVTPTSFNDYGLNADVCNDIISDVGYMFQTRICNVGDHVGECIEIRAQIYDFLAKLISKYSLFLKITVCY